jgi:glycosyltransferase involved in cell wall biosynthesis
MKVALVNKHLHLGGIETVVHQIRTGLPARGHQCDLWYSEYNSAPPRADCRPLYPRLLGRLQHSRFAPLVESLFPRRASTERTFRRLLTSDYDLVHIHGFDESYASLEALRALAEARPTVVSLHGSWFFTGGCGQPLDCLRYTTGCGSCPQLGVWPVPHADNTAAQISHKAAVLGSAPITFVSPARHLRDKAAASVPGRRWKIECLPNGVDCDFFRAARKHDSVLRQSFGIVPQATVVLALCRNFRDPVKGFPVMREALATLQNTHVILAGLHAPDAAREMPSHLPVTVYDFIADRRRCAELYEIADVFLFSSLAETFPCVVLEAMSAGCCVVAAPSDSISEQIADGITGLVADACTGEALARQLRRACADASLRRAVGLAARERVRREFSESVMIDRHLALYERLLA